MRVFNELFDSHYSHLYSYVLKLTNNSEIAKDIVQESYIKLWNKRQDLDLNLSVKNYLFKICHNEFLIYFRKKKKENSLFDELKFEVAQTIHAPTENSKIRMIQVEKALKKLPKRAKEAFILSKINHLKYKQIAIEMGISIKTVEKHISKALKFLKKTTLNEA